MLKKTVGDTSLVLISVSGEAIGSMTSAAEDKALRLNTERRTAGENYAHWRKSYNIGSMPEKLPVFRFFRWFAENRPIFSEFSWTETENRTTFWTYSNAYEGIEVSRRPAKEDAVKNLLPGSGELALLMTVDVPFHLSVVFPDSADPFRDFWEMATENFPENAEVPSELTDDISAFFRNARLSVALVLNDENKLGEAYIIVEYAGVDQIDKLFSYAPIIGAQAIELEGWNTAYKLTGPAVPAVFARTGDTVLFGVGDSDGYNKSAKIPDNVDGAGVSDRSAAMNFFITQRVFSAYEAFKDDFKLNDRPDQPLDSDRRLLRALVDMYDINAMEAVSLAIKDSATSETTVYWKD
jgi:hypothetical protein